MLFHIYKCHRFRKSNQNRSPGLGIPAEWQHSKVSRRNVTQTRKTSKAVKIRKLPHVLWVSNWNSETIPKLCRSVLKSWSMKNSVTSRWDLESQPIPWQTAVKPSSKASFSAQMFWARSSTSCSRRLYGYAFASIFSCCCTKQCFEYLEQLSWTNSYLMNLASQV